VNTPPRPDLDHEPHLGRSWTDLSLEIKALVVFASIGAGFMALLIWIGWF
jgi:hypothetical protein